MLVFLGGVGLLLLTFKLAFEMFSVPPDQALPLKSGDTMQIPLVASTVTGLVFRILLLIVMAMVGSFIANRGIHLYTESHRHAKPTPAPPAAVEHSDA